MQSCHLISDKKYLLGKRHLIHNINDWKYLWGARQLKQNIPLAGRVEPIEVL